MSWLPVHDRRKPSCGNELIAEADAVRQSDFAKCKPQTHPHFKAAYHKGKGDVRSRGCGCCTGFFSAPSIAFFCSAVSKASSFSANFVATSLVSKLESLTTRPPSRQVS
jgi:hypothetical protein